MAIYNSSGISKIEFPGINYGSSFCTFSLFGYELRNIQFELFKCNLSGSS